MRRMCSESAICRCLTLASALGSEKIVFSMYFSDSKGNKVDAAEYGIEHEAIEDVYDVILFEDLGNGQTKLTFMGNDTQKNAIESGQYEGWKETLDKVAAVVAELVQAK